VRICILLHAAVPSHLRETVRRNGLQVVRVGVPLRVTIGSTLLGFEESAVWIDEEEPPPGEGPGGSARESQPGA
jgi:hypothetical protein